jgi:single-stranded-DNA-specific exonuclease
MDEGYGLTAAALERIYQRDPEVVITVDCGISSREEVAALIARGIAVLVTDHHEPSDAVPHNIPVTDPKITKDSPHSLLAGVGVALKLIALVGERFGQPSLWRDLVDLATLGTLADLMPLIGENRSLVAEGLRLLEQAPRPGIASALALSQREQRPISATNLSFSLIPRLNAAGRMGDPARALELLINDDPLQAFEVANALDVANGERRATESALFNEVLAQVERVYQRQKILIVAGEGWHEGVRGIVASRLASRYGIPVIVFTLAHGQARGSGRSIGVVNLFKAVERCAELTERFGGHEAAVGVTISPDQLDEFTRRMEAVMEEEPEENFHPPQMVDAQLALADFDVASVEQLGLLEPYGQENREPLYVSCGVFLRNARAVGAKKNHLAFTATDGKSSAQAIWFQCPAVADFIACDGAVDIIYRLQVDEWSGLKRTKLMVVNVFRADEDDDAAGGGASTGEVMDGKGAVGETAASAAATGASAAATGATTIGKGAVGFLAETPSSELRALWEQKARAGLSSFTRELATEILGVPISPRPAQLEALNALDEGCSVLVIMATGRGKSLIFQAHAARLALTLKQASVFIYPLRALIADQAVSLVEGFARLGLNARTLTGETASGEKDLLFQGLYEDRIDVLLTTPEFFSLHVWRFAESRRVGCIVFDEAHHLYTERASGREAYQNFDELHGWFPHAHYLAVTATSDNDITDAIGRTLGISRIIIDSARRENLRIDDARNLKERELYLSSIVTGASKTVVYANSRAQAVVLIRMLRKQIPGQANALAFYHAGLTRAERKAIEEGFRLGSLSAIVSTSAFGEGVNISDISDVIVYHLPFSAVAFNQMSGRAGRNGQPAVVHLLYTEDDADLNRKLLVSHAPAREELVVLYRVLKERCRDENAGSSAGGSTGGSTGGSAGDPAGGNAGGMGAAVIDDIAISGDMPSTRAAGIAAGFLTASSEQLAEACRRQDSRCGLDTDGVSSGLAIFEELDLVRLLGSDDGYPEQTIKLAFNKKVELSASSRYLEGREELALFERFRTWAFEATADELREQIIGPLTPSEGRNANEQRANGHNASGRNASGHNVSGGYGRYSLASREGMCERL